MPSDDLNNESHIEENSTANDDINSFNYDSIQFCWHCGHDISQQEEDKYCLNCRAPLDEITRRKIFTREESTDNVKCWFCNATTSGYVCGVCGSPLTKKGLEILPKGPKKESEEEIDAISIFSPKDRSFKPIEISFETLTETIKKYVTIADSKNTEAGPVFIIERPELVNETFEELRNESVFIENNLKVIIRNEQINPQEKKITLRFFYWRKETAKERFNIKGILLNVGLFLATIATVAIAGWQYTKNIYDTYLFTGRPALDVFLYTISLMAILTIHELGHYVISRFKKLDASLPYFIPVPPIAGFQTIGTFGALIRQKEPFATRDDLFDIGIAGPIAGFVVTIPVFLIGLKLTYVVDIPPDLPAVNAAEAPIILLEEFLIIISQYIGILPYYDPTIQTVAMHPMMFAGYVGFILTGLNLMPASQLDGGHTSRAVFGPNVHRIVSLIVALILVLNPFTRIFGMLVLVMSFMQHTGAMDDVSKVHWSKYIYVGISFIVGILCLPMPRIEFYQSLFAG